MSSMELRQRRASYTLDKTLLPKGEPDSQIQTPVRNLPPNPNAEHSLFSERVTTVMRLLCLNDGQTPPAAPQPPHTSRQLFLCQSDELALAGRKDMKDPWVPRNLTTAKCAEKMLKNAKKALREHFLHVQRQIIMNGEINATLQDNPYALSSQVFETGNSSAQPTNNSSLSFSHSIVQAQGPRPYMEDVHFYHETNEYILTGIFDGHSGPHVADFARDRFPKKFLSFLNPQRDNIHYAYEETIYSIQKEIEWLVHKWETEHPGVRYRGGSTMVCCFIDKKTRKVTTATVGDSEANIYRYFEKEGIKSIPLSCVRDWHSKKDAQRASISLRDPNIAAQWPKAEDPKLLRYPPNIGVNVSRAFGDIYLRGTKEEPGLLCKPKITEMAFEKGDQFLLCSDGLKDALIEDLLVYLLTICDVSNVAEYILNNALAEMEKQKSGDNVTITYISVV